MLNPKAGDVYLLYCAIIRDPKEKFHAVAYMEPRLRYFLINSRVAAFIQAKPILAAHQVLLKQSEHPEFLKEDSYLDCTQIFGGLTASELEDLIAAGHRVELGRISTNARREVRRVIKDSELLTPHEIKAILAVW